MKQLVWTPKFLKSARKFLEDCPDYSNLFKERIQLIEENPFNPSLKTHKLKGNLKDFYSSSLNYNYRIVFQFDENDDGLIILCNIGTHDEVY